MQVACQLPRRAVLISPTAIMPAFAGLGSPLAGFWDGSGNVTRRVTFCP